MSLGRDHWGFHSPSVWFRENFLTNTSGWQHLAFYHCRKREREQRQTVPSDLLQQKVPAPTKHPCQSQSWLCCSLKLYCQLTGIGDRGYKSWRDSQPSAVEPSVPWLSGQKHKKGFKGTRRAHLSNVLDPYLDKPTLERLLFMRQLATLEHRLNSWQNSS